MLYITEQQKEQLKTKENVQQRKMKDEKIHAKMGPSSADAPRNIKTLITQSAKHNSY